MTRADDRRSRPIAVLAHLLPVVRCAVTALGIGVSLGAASAQETRLQPHFGKQTYSLFCSGCHGSDGRGETAIAEALDLEAIDLTRISARHGGHFPADEVKAAITGASEAAGHKRLALEPWGRMFADEFDDFAERAVVNQLVARRIDHLIAYLESIQR
jgi:hypothetical protein